MEKSERQIEIEYIFYRLRKCMVEGHDDFEGHYCIKMEDFDYLEEYFKEKE